MNRSVIILLSLVFMLILSVAGCSNNNEKESSTDTPAAPTKTEVIKNANESFRKDGIDYKKGLQEYNTFGDYLNYSKWKYYAAEGADNFDENGIYRVKRGEEYLYNITTIAQYALVNYGKFLSGNDDAKVIFLKHAEKLLELQDEKGAFRYGYTWRHYLETEAYKPGWVSAMAQGQAMSVFARAYDVTQDKKYLKAGNEAFDFLLTPIEDGGLKTTMADLDADLKDYVFFEEYVTNPNNYALNGYMFTLLGIYDWSQASDKFQSQNENQAKSVFDSGIKTLVKILPYYDLGEFSAYDLGHITFKKDVPHIGIGYHAVHIYQLKALHSITGEDTFKTYQDKWSGYVD